MNKFTIYGHRDRQASNSYYEQWMGWHIHRVDAHTVERVTNANETVTLGSLFYLLHRPKLTIGFSSEPETSPSSADSLYQNGTPLNVISIFFFFSLFRGILSRSLSISSARPPGQVKEGIIDFSIEKMRTTDMGERSASSDKRSSSSSTQRPYFILGKSRESDRVARLAWILRPPNSKYPAGARSLSFSILTITTHIYTSSMIPWVLSVNCVLLSDSRTTCCEEKDQRDYRLPFLSLYLVTNKRLRGK